MPFDVKNWEDDPIETTPLSAAALEDLEERLSDYVDSSAGVIEIDEATVITSSLADDATSVESITFAEVF
jgi:hypothetical protein